MPSRAFRFLFGDKKDVKDKEAFHKLSLVALLAWVGLGADGLSSSAYGPDEAFRALGAHTGLCVFLAVATALTVFIIGYGYSRIIEHFPTGGGGYVVASKLLGPYSGLTSGCALLVDYVLTITISIASGADAILSFLPPTMLWLKTPMMIAGISVLMMLNLRGVKESVTSLVPIFAVFLLAHAVMLGFGIFGNVSHATETIDTVKANLASSHTELGGIGMLSLFVGAYSMGGGTYTGIEAVSNGVGMMREPRVRTAKRTMVLMAASLALTAGGIILCYLLVNASVEPDKTMNAVLLERIVAGWPAVLGKPFVIVTLVSEGALLFVAAQAGFLDGPRVMANMAVDSWLPHRFAALSDRLTMKNGILLMSGAAFGALAYTRGDVGKLVVMYSINVFLTFSLSNLAMMIFWWRRRHMDPTWFRHLPAHTLAFVLCMTILGVTIWKKFSEGGWLTMIITMVLVVACIMVKRHYLFVAKSVKRLDRDLPSPPEVDKPEEDARMAQTDHRGNEVEVPKMANVAVLFVGGYGGLGRHALLTLLRMFPGHFQHIAFLSVAVVDSESFKGPDEIVALETRTRESLEKYVRYAKTLGVTASYELAVGTEVAAEAEKIALKMREKYPRSIFVAGQLVFDVETVATRVLHNQTAQILQHRLQRSGVPMINVPVRIDLYKGEPRAA